MIAIPNETPVQEIQRNFTDELRSKMKEAALKLGVPVEMLKYRVMNNGMVEIEVMDVQEAEDRHREEMVAKRVREIKKARNRFYA